MIDTDTVARTFVEQHHYSHSYPAARVRVGLYERGTLVGVAVFSVGSNPRTLLNVWPATPLAQLVELGRFVLVDRVGFNGETWFLARCFEHLRAQGYRGVLSMSDPVPRTSSDGITVFPGHTGTIYRAHNGQYLGRATPRLHRLLPDGRIVDPRAIQKVRKGECGWLTVPRLLGEFGAPLPARTASVDERLDWLGEWIPKLTRPLRHPGNYRYAWALTRRVSLPPPLAYPKAA